MATLSLEGHHGAVVDIDECSGCHAFWFDRRESLQLAPASTLRLFTLIGEAFARGRGVIASVIKCPRCGSRLIETRDMQRNTAFRYWRCPHDHGRLISFFDFLREKDFIRPLSAQQIEELRRNVQIVNCSNCGGPIDLAKGAACAHCGAPVSVLDMKQAEAVVAQLRQASEPKPVDPWLPIELEKIRREADAAFGGSGAVPDWWTNAASFGLVEASLGAIVRLLKK